MDGCVKQNDEEEQKKTIARKYFNLTHILGNGTGNTHPYFVCIELNSYARTYEFMSGIDYGTCPWIFSLSIKYLKIPL